MRAALTVLAAAVLLLAARPGASQQASTPRPFTVVETSIADLQRALRDGRATSRSITEQFLARISRYNRTLRAAITVNDAALAEADARDRERRPGRPLGPLHGIPIALKDNIQTLGMPTTGGALALKSLTAPYEATIARHLREAGAIIVAKTTLTELANWVADDMPTGYNALLGYSANPYEPAWTRRGDIDVPARLPGGSSSGIGTAASLWAANVGTETSGSILNPSHETMLVGVKPTVGRLSRHGLIPITLDQDTPGPMARTVTDAAILLGAMEGAAGDPNDPATGACRPPADRDYRPYLRADALKGARIGIPRAFFYERRAGVGLGGGGLLTAAQERLMSDAVSLLRRAGATVVDPASLPSITATDAGRNILQFPVCVGTRDARERQCSSVLRYGMKRDFNRWLTSLGGSAPVKSLAELRAWNLAHRDEGSLRFGQSQLDASDAVDLERDRARYLDDLAKDRRLARAEGLDAALRSHTLDALLFPAYFGAPVAARAGYPSVIVPFAETPATGTSPTPFSVTFTGTACSEPRLLALAYAFEQASRRRVPPALK